MPVRRLASWRRAALWLGPRGRWRAGQGRGWGGRWGEAGGAVGELAEGGVGAGSAGTLTVVAGACSGGGMEGGEGLGHERVDEPVVAHVPGGDGLFLAGSAGDGAGSGVVLPGPGGGVPAG